MSETLNKYRVSTRRSAELALLVGAWLIGVFAWILVDAATGETSNVIPVKYCPPFFGATGGLYNGLNTGNDQAYNDTQKSYGMCFVPPDVGVTVLVGVGVTDAVGVGVK